MLWDLALTFLRLGATSFGGPLAHIALMRSEFVDKRQWLSDAEFLDLNGAVNLIPGPNSTELAMHIGHRRAGFAGLCVAGAAFIAPAMLMVMVLAALYQKFGALPAAREILWGVSPVVVAVVFQALTKFAQSAPKTPLAIAVFVLALGAAALGINEIILIFAAALVGIIAGFVMVPSVRKTSVTPNSIVLLLLPKVALPVGSLGVFAVFWSFLKMGCVVYGSGYVLLAYLRAELVEKLGWISQQQLLDAVAVGQVTPGPVFTTATFLGWQIDGFWGALAATAGIFGPSFLFVALLSSVLNRLSGSKRARIFLDVVSAASFALMGMVTFELARQTVFPKAHLDWLALLIGLGSAFLLLRTKINSAWLLAGGAVLGLLFGR